MKGYMGRENSGGEKREERSHSDRIQKALNWGENVLDAGAENVKALERQ